MNIHTMDAEARYYQFTVENQVLDHIKSALRQTLSADEDRMGLERKVSTVRFVTESLQRHLSRMLDLEEAEPLVDAVGDNCEKPSVSERAWMLHNDHVKMRATLDQLASMCAQLRTDNEAMFEDFSEQLSEFIDQLDRHELAEQKLLQEIYEAAEGLEGGEG